MPENGYAGYNKNCLKAVYYLFNRMSFEERNEIKEVKNMIIMHNLCMNKYTLNVQFK